MIKISAVASTICSVGLGMAVSAKPLQDRGDGNGRALCSGFTPPILDGAYILSVTSTELRNYTVPAAPILGLLNPIPSVNVCNVNVTYTHPGANDTVAVQIWLPLDNYNGVFVSVGGSAWAAGLGEISLAPLAIQGYAAVSSDAGLAGPFIPQAIGLLS